MTRPEPAGAGTAMQHATIRRRAIVLQLLTDIDTIAPIPTEKVDAVIAAITAAITAAESRAMERCAKMADKYADDSEAAAEQFDDMAKRQSNDDDYFRLALTRRRIAGDMRLFAKGIRSSINPPGEEE